MFRLHVSKFYIYRQKQTEGNDKYFNKGKWLSRYEKINYFIAVVNETHFEWEQRFEMYNWIIPQEENEIDSF